MTGIFDDNQLSKMSIKQLLFEWQTTKEAIGQYYAHQKKIEEEIATRAKLIREEGAKNGVVDWKEE